MIASTLLVVIFWDALTLLVYMLRLYTSTAVMFEAVMRSDTVKFDVDMLEFSKLVTAASTTFNVVTSAVDAFTLHVAISMTCMLLDCMLNTCALS